jgi:hypothetical protein
MINVNLMESSIHGFFIRSAFGISMELLLLSNYMPVTVGFSFVNILI